MASDPEELLAAIDEAEVIGTVTDAMGDWVKVGVLRTAVLIGVSGSPGILDMPEIENPRQARAAMEGATGSMKMGMITRVLQKMSEQDAARKAGR